MSNVLNPDQDQRSVVPDLGSTDCKGHQQKTRVTISKIMKTKRVSDHKVLFVFLKIQVLHAYTFKIPSPQEKT